MEEKQKTFDDIKEEIVLNGSVSDEQENIIVEAARREIELERAKNRPMTPSN